MEQRRLRLGDILDDYCPRERRVTNHAVVAMVDEDVKQTRCTTCDAEHAYKGAKVPRRRKKETPSALYKEVLAGMPESDAAPILTTPPSNGHGVAADSVDVDEPHTDETDDHAAIDEPQPSRNVVAAFVRRSRESRARRTCVPCRNSPSVSPAPAAETGTSVAAAATPG
jgi:hypothetical protein